MLEGKKLKEQEESSSCREKPIINNSSKAMIQGKIDPNPVNRLSGKKNSPPSSVRKNKLKPVTMVYL